jgi:hypothetical protein
MKLLLMLLANMGNNYTDNKRFWYDDAEMLHVILKQFICTECLCLHLYFD